MAQFEIYWSDLTEEAQNRLSELYHDNIELAPLTIIEIDNVQETTEEDQKKADIKYITDVINEWGSFTAGERGEDSPTINSIGDGDVCELAEGFNDKFVSTIVYDNGMEVEYHEYKYEELNADVISEIRIIAENYESEMIDTMSKCSGYDY